MESLKGVVIAISILVVMGVTIQLYLGYSYSVANQSRSPAYIKSHHIGYTEVDLNIKQSYSTQFGGNAYSFEYVGEYQGSNSFVVEYVGGIGGQIFNAVKDSTYDTMGLEIQVGDVNSTSLILWIKSTTS
jgi:hypothetical protein